MDEQEKIVDQNKQLKALNEIQEFRAWRDSYVLPELEQIEIAKAKVMEMTEAEIKAIILYEQKIKYLFNKIFEI